jgi:hypothetical protein
VTPRVVKRTRVRGVDVVVLDAPHGPGIGDGMVDFITAARALPMTEGLQIVTNLPGSANGAAERALDLFGLAARRQQRRR